MTNKQDLIRVACIGAGYFSQFHYDAWRRIDHAVLVASADKDIEKAKRTGTDAYDNLATMLEAKKPDLLDIITPPETHLDHIKTALESGVRAIICQKPFCRDINEAREAVALADVKNTPLIVHENFRFQPWYRTMKSAINSGVLGEVHQITFRLRTGDSQGDNAYLDRQPYFQHMKKFLIHETGVHWIDTFRYLLGEPKSVYADLRKMNPVIAGEDAGYFIMGFECGAKALFDANRHLDHNSENHRLTLGECLLEGTEATISLSGDGIVRLRKFNSTEEKILLKAQNWPGFGGDCVHALQSHVISGLLDGSNFENPAADYLSVLELEAAIYNSAETGQKQSLR